jgi:hypothetical protein
MLQGEATDYPMTYFSASRSKMGRSQANRKIVYDVYDNLRLLARVIKKLLPLKPRKPNPGFRRFNTADDNTTITTVVSYHTHYSTTRDVYLLTSAKTVCLFVQINSISTTDIIRTETEEHGRHSACASYNDL